MTRISRKPGDSPIETDTNWDAIRALTEEQIHSAALADADAQPIPLGTDQELAQTGLHRVVNTRKLRDRLGLTQEAFAARYQIPVGTLRDWEQQRKMPDAPARAYLIVIEKNPEAVAAWLGAA
jgi:putative transcriptional regulator